MAVQFRFTGDDKDVQRALQAMEKRYNDLINATKKGTDETKKMAEAAKKAFDDTRTPQENYKKRMEQLNELVKKGAIDQETYARAAKKASDELGKADGSSKGIAAGAAATLKNWLSITGAIEAANAALEKQNKLNEKARTAQLSEADVQAKVIRNMGDVTPQERDRLLARMNEIAKSNKQDPIETKLLASDAFSAGGNKDKALDAVSIAQKLVPERGANDERQIVSGAILDMAKLTKSDDMLKNAGLLQAMGATARVTSISETAKNLMPALMGMAETGGTVQENMAILGALTQAGDVTGAHTGTAGGQLAKQLKERFPEVDTPGKEDEHGRAKIIRGTGLASPLERIRRLQADAVESQRFMTNSSFETKSEGAVGQLVRSSQTSIGQALEENLGGAVPTLENAGNYAQRVIDNYRGTAAGELGLMNRGTNNLRQRIALADPQEAVKAEIRGRLTDILDETEWNPISEYMGAKRFDAMVAAGNDPADEFDVGTRRARKALEFQENAGMIGDKDREILSAIREWSKENRDTNAILRQIRDRGGRPRELHAE